MRTWLEGQAPDEALIDQLGMVFGASSGGIRREVENHELPSDEADMEFVRYGDAARLDRASSRRLLQAKAVVAPRRSIADSGHQRLPSEAFAHQIPAHGPFRGHPSIIGSNAGLDSICILRGLPMWL